TRIAGELGRTAHGGQQLLQSQIPDAGAAGASRRQPEPERRPGGQRDSRTDASRQLRVLDRLSPALLARRPRRAAPDAGREPAPLGRGRRAAGSSADLSARLPAARHADEPRIPGSASAQPLVFLPPAAGLAHAAMTGALMAAALPATGPDAPARF